jgi:hypothetical protein
VALHHAAKGVEEGLERATALKHGKGALVESVAQGPPLVADRWLRRAHDHGRWRGIHAAQDLEDARTGGLTRAITNWQPDVDHRNVDLDLTNDLVALGQVARPQAPNPLRLKQTRQQVGEGVIAPPTVGKEQIQIGSAAIML